MKHTIEEIKGMLEGITPGEWIIDPIAKGHVKSEPSGRSIVSCSYSNNYDDGEHIKENYANARLIATTPTVIRDLLAKIESYQRKHVEVADRGSICPKGGVCNVEDGVCNCEKCWLAYWEGE